MTQKNSYHHGDLRDSLLDCAHRLIAEEGIESLSLRKLAERVGVSRTAPYHHFKNKHELLCAIAERGFVQWTDKAEAIFTDQTLSKRERFRRFFLDYVMYAVENPQLYELMFGQTIWQANGGTASLKEVAYPAFQYQVTMTANWQRDGLLPGDQDALRLAQVTWGTMHGIARLLIDGIYADTSHVGDMVDCAVELFIRD